MIIKPIIKLVMRKKFLKSVRRRKYPYAPALFDASLTKRSVDAAAANSRTHTRHHPYTTYVIRSLVRSFVLASGGAALWPRLRNGWAQQHVVRQAVTQSLDAYIYIYARTRVRAGTRTCCERCTRIPAHRSVSN